MATATMSRTDVNLCRAQSVLDKTWRRMNDSFLSRLVEGRPVDSFPDLSEAEAQRTASHARAALAAIDGIELEALPHPVALSVRSARFQLGIDVQAGERYWLAQDYVGYQAMFPVGPYGGGHLFRRALGVFGDFTFSRPGDCDRYLALLEDLARLIDQMREKLTGQAARGVRVPQAALPVVRTLLTSQVDAVRKRLPVDSGRLRAIAAPRDFAERTARRIDERIVPALAALSQILDDEYAARAPERVGLCQFENGARVYESLAAEHLSMPLTIEEVHGAGHERMARVEDEMARIRAALGYADRDEFHHYLRTDPAWVAHSEEQLQARFDGALRRIEPHIDSLFHFKPAARYRAARLDPRLEAGVTYGYYQEPGAGHPDGVYYFNASNLSERTLATAPSLIYHELIPGHHTHCASEVENELLRPLRRDFPFTAFNEGWAEYAATLAGEIGMYADPCERYGRLIFDAFLTCRLVVDTGMNALGWSLQQARQYLRDHTVMSEAEIRSETLRYSTDIPAKQLPYKMGEIKIHGLRERVRTALGDRFDIRDFHDVVLRFGAMPLEVLEWHVDAWLRAQTQADVRTSKSQPGVRT